MPIPRRLLRALLLGECAALSALGAGAAPAESVSFRHDVMAVLSQAGCNSGPCHGNQNGKNGFKLSLRGEDPSFDLTALTRDAFGRRIDLFHPEGSLLLLKATQAIPHEGGRRFRAGDPAYRILRDWIAAGAAEDPPGLPLPETLELDPPARYLDPPEDRFSVRVTARFSDGSERDVTGLSVFESSDPFLETAPGGQIIARSPGEGVVLVRYLALQVPVRVFRLAAPPGTAWDYPDALNFIDEAVFAKLRRLRIPASPPASDAVFARRLSLDLLGRIPTAGELRAFLADPSPDRRDRLVDLLLEDPGFADFWAMKWCDVLRVEERALDRKGVQTMHRWIRDAIRDRMPLDRFAASLVSATGSTYTHPPANFYRAHRTPVARAETVSQVFLGTRLQCAQCHNHPFDRWTQDDYYGWNAVFAGVRYKVLENRRTDSNDSHEFIGEQVIWSSPEGVEHHPVRGTPVPPRFLGESGPVPESADRLDALAGWLTAPANRQFARVQANRVWFHLMGRGLVHPIDDFRATNPPSHPELLERLAGELTGSGWDLRHLVRLIAGSQAYRLSSIPEPENAADAINYSHPAPRRLGAEQILDSLAIALGVPVRFEGYPPGLRATQIPGVRAVRARQPSGGDQFLQVFGKPPRLSSSEEERSCSTSMSQVFHLVSGELLHELLTDPANRLDQLAAGASGDPALIEELYAWTLGRPPSEEERRGLSGHLANAPDRRRALEDLAWALVNSKEFLLRH